MLFIEHYSVAFDFHKKLLSCWLKTKIHGVNRTNNICNYCNDSKCLNTKTENYGPIDRKIKKFFSINKIDKLLSAQPKELLAIHNNYSLLKISNDPDKDEALKKILEDLFRLTGYKRFFQKTHGRNFLNLLNRSTCTYCNRNYTLNISKNHASAQLDHWFPKDKFPILALSFYNLIPSCGSCNHIKGSSKDLSWWKNVALDEMLHPYFPEPDALFKFDFRFERSKDEFEVLFRDVKGGKTQQTLNFNKTKQIYQAHANLELRDLYNLRKKYPKNYLKHLLENMLSGHINEVEKYRLIFGIEKNEKDYHKRPFSKFKNDIIEKLLEMS
ncbi:HNH endonuclease [Elizabethkingia meningoseptica]|uniref:HNH endonuclease n=1 Tax=Elizabethkingia meningoseptica TaxID=238 RepID=UPI002DD6966E|nr:HNH endonuclease [Elizabethkingia meningoseptica]MEC4711062.1 HNH endonuclease [Elizabethkingia meningoseptica]